MIWLHKYTHKEESHRCGTLLLDEIGDMPLSLQMKLLRLLQEYEITPVGGSTSIKVDTRIIAATHRDILVEAFSYKADNKVQNPSN